MAEKIDVMRSQLGRARGLGSAKTGTEHLWAERVTSFGLIPLTLWFVSSSLSLLGADQPVVAAWIAKPLNTVLLLALIALTFHHAQLGLQVVYEDYMKGAQRTAAVLATKFVALLLGLLASLAVLKLALGH